MKQGPGLEGPIPWDKAPNGTTHAFRGPRYDYWMQQTAKGWLYWNRIHQKWVIDGSPKYEYHIARPMTDCPYLEQPDAVSYTHLTLPTIYSV